MVLDGYYYGLAMIGQPCFAAGWRAVVGASGVPAGILLPVVLPRSGESHSGLGWSAGLSGDGKVTEVGVPL